MSLPTPPVGVDLLESHATPAEQLLVAWLAPLRRSAVTREVGDPLPFTIITEITGGSDACLELSDPVVSVHTLCDKALGFAAAMTEADFTDRRMGELERYLSTITLSDGTEASVDYVQCTESPKWVEFQNTQILRKVGRYKLGISYVPVSP